MPQLHPVMNQHHPSPSQSPDKDSIANRTNRIGFADLRYLSASARLVILRSDEKDYVGAIELIRPAVKVASQGLELSKRCTGKVAALAASEKWEPYFSGIKKSLESHLNAISPPIKDDFKVDITRVFLLNNANAIETYILKEDPITLKDYFIEVFDL